MAAGIALVILALYWTRRLKPQAAEGLALPAQITPFTVVAFLRRIQKESSARLDESSRSALLRQIQEIEAAFFSTATVPTSSPDLESIARKWRQAVG